MSLSINDLNITGSTSGMSLNNISSINGGQLAGFRNKIINGNMGIYQRGTAAVTTNGGFGADRWVNNATGSTFSTTQGDFVSGDTLFDTGGADHFTQIAVTSVAGAGNFVLFRQRIEDVRILSNKTVTVSFWSRATSGTPSIGISIDQNYGTGGSAQVQGTGQAQALSTTWTKYTKTFTIPSINGKTIGTEATHFTTLNFWIDAGSTFNTLSGSIGQSSKTVQIAQVQLEEGSVATPFEFRPYQTELALCQRYYYRIKSDGTATAPPVGFGSFASTTNASAFVQLPVSMRIPPSSVGASSSTALTASDWVTPLTSSAVAISGTNQTTFNGVDIALTVAGATQYRPCIINLNGVSAWIDFGAEL